MKTLHKIAFAVFGLALSGQVLADKLYEVKTSGIMIKDSLEVHVMDDPTIDGITCYYTLPKRSLSFEDQTNTSISCRQVGRINGNLTSKKNVMSASKSWFFKSLKMDRIYDKKRNVLIYVTYTKKLAGDNASNSISVVPIKKY